ASAPGSSAAGTGELKPRVQPGRARPGVRRARDQGPQPRPVEVQTGSAERGAQRGDSGRVGVRPVGGTRPGPQQPAMDDDPVVGCAWPVVGEQRVRDLGRSVMVRAPAERR
ncbi:hypothetical protein AN220_12570, partial [Streptomyces nanshensis]